MSPALPIHAVLDKLSAVIAHHNSVILSAPPGTGKSTAVPLALLKHPALVGRKIIMLEPRRVAAKAIADYLASQLNEPVGHTVGVRMRQGSCVGKHTRLEVVTEGILVRMLQSDPELTGVGLVIFDEFHERSIHADLSLVFCQEVQQALNPDLKLLVMSATLDNLQLSRCLAAKVVVCEASAYPVDKRYLAASGDVVADIKRKIPEILDTDHGSILVFLPGKREILALYDAIKADCDRQGIGLFAVYGKLDIKAQQQAIAPPSTGQRKIVIATNLAETSITIDGVRIVVDSGLKRSAEFYPKNGITQLRIKQISRASATQRAGRAGRQESGVCYRFGSDEQYQRRQAFDEPEIAVSDLSSLVMEVALWGAQIEDLNWITAPPAPLVEQARALLRQLEALDEHNRLTPFGQQMAALAAGPRLAHMLLKVKQARPRVLMQACLLAALAEHGDVSVNAPDSDIEHRLYFLASRQNHPVFRQAESWWRSLMGRASFCPRSDLFEPSGLILAYAFPDRIAKKRGKSYLMTSGAGVSLYADDAMIRHQWVVAVDVADLEKSVKCRLSAAFDPAWFNAELSYLVSENNTTGWDEKMDAFVICNERFVGQLVLSSEKIQKPVTFDALQEMLIAQVKSEKEKVVKFQIEDNQLINKNNLAAKYFPEESFKPLSKAVLFSDVDHWIAPYLVAIKSVSALKKMPLQDSIKSYIGWDKVEKLKKWFPDSYIAPTGVKHRLVYDESGTVKLSVRMQEMYGLTVHPCVACGQLPIVIELLSPAGRPMQITRDLPGFWLSSYACVRKDMKGRYPKHFWPENPENAQATLKTKKHMQG